MGQRESRRESLARVAIASAGAAMAVLALALSELGPADAAIRATGDWLVRIAPKPNPPIPFALVLIDSSTMELDQLAPEEIEASPELRAIKAGFPWTRAVYAAALERLIKAGAGVIILDVLLIGPREGDDALRDVLERHPGKVVLMSNVVQDLGHEGGDMWRYQQPSEDAIPAGGTPIGFANFFRDPDGVVRSAPFRMHRRGQPPEHSSPATALGILKGEAARDALPDSAHFLPAMEGMRPEVRVPLWQLFSPREWEHNLKGGRVFEGAAVAIGASAPQFHDEFLTPVGQVVGAGLHLGALGAAWEGAFYRIPGWPAVVVACVLGGLCSFAVWALVRGELWRLLVLGGFAALAVQVSVSFLTGLGILAPLAAFWAAAGLGATANLTADLLSEARERLRARRILERYVSPGLASEILDERSQFLQSLGGTRREVTILFSDVRGFTSLAESSEPTDIFEQLNAYLGIMVARVLESGGGVDKFLGDGILAVWGSLARRDAATEASSALSCARAMKGALVGFNEQRAAAGLQPWKIGIGIHSGDVLFGNIGSEARMEPTVIGDTVNLASRIEGLTKSLGVEILFSVSTAELAAVAGDARSADRVRVIGRKAPVDLFTFWPDEFHAADRTAHEAAIAAYREGRFADAIRAFEDVLSRHPEDGLARILAARSAELLAAPPEGLWEGVFVARSK